MSPRYPLPPELGEALPRILSRLFDIDGASFGFSQLVPSKNIADETIKIGVSNAQQRSIAVVIYAKTHLSDLVARNSDKAARIKKYLGPNLGRVILDPLHEETIDQHQLAVMPFCAKLSQRPVAKWVSHYYLMPTILKWLGDITVQTCDRSSPRQTQKTFEQCLTHLLGRTTLPHAIHQLAQTSLDRLRNNHWEPAHVLMHGDLWANNIMIAPKTLPDFKNRSWRQRMVIIDWPGAEISGYAMYDLIRLAISFRIPNGVLYRQIKAHCHILQCDVQDAVGHLLCALGHIGQYQNAFPEARYLYTALRCIDHINACLKACG
jgi:hypothetical protein